VHGFLSERAVKDIKDLKDQKDEKGTGPGRFSFVLAVL